MGRKFFIRTSYANVVTTLGLIYLKPFPAITTSELLIVLYGGVLFGVGVGIVVKWAEQLMDRNVSCLDE